MTLDKRLLNFLVIIILSFFTFWCTGFVFHIPFSFEPFLVIVMARILASFLIFRDYSLSWSKATQKTFLIKAIVYCASFAAYVPFLYSEVRLAFLQKSATLEHIFQKYLNSVYSFTWTLISVYIWTLLESNRNISFI